jgi:hypothetical protein
MTQAQVRAVRRRARLKRKTPKPIKIEPRTAVKSKGKK